MVTKALPRGMGSFFKDCNCDKPSRCPHPYKIRYRDAGGRQREESDYRTQQHAIDRLTEIYNTKRSSGARQQADDWAKMTFGEYTEQWLRSRRRGWAIGTEDTYKSTLNAQILPRLKSRKVGTFAPSVIEDFILSMEEDEVKLGAQNKAFETLKKMLAAAIKRGAIKADPFEDVTPPEYIRKNILVPTMDEILAMKKVASDDVRLIIDLMSGCGLRNGEAYAANPRWIVADDVYRINGQINGIKRVTAPLKHRKPGEFREVPLPSKVKETILRHERDHGTDTDGYMLFTQKLPIRYYGHTSLDRRWKACLRDAEIETGYTPYCLRHYFASNCLSRNIPITDVAGWMGHKSIEVTYRIYRHLMPSSIGRAARILNEGL